MWLLACTAGILRACLQGDQASFLGRKTTATVLLEIRFLWFTATFTFCGVFGIIDRNKSEQGLLIEIEKLIGLIS